MTRSAKITLTWADGDYPFRLSIEQLAELQEKTDAGPWYIQWALSMMLVSGQTGLAPAKDAGTSYVTEPIRLGLIGGGMDAMKALRLVRRYAGVAQLTENISVAYAILGAALQGIDEDEPEKSQGESPMSASLSPEDESGSLNSTELAPQLD